MAIAGFESKRDLERKMRTISELDDLTQRIDIGDPDGLYVYLVANHRHNQSEDVCIGIADFGETWICYWNEESTNTTCERLVYLIAEEETLIDVYLPDRENYDQMMEHLAARILTRDGYDGNSMMRAVIQYRESQIDRENPTMYVENLIQYFPPTISAVQQ